MKPGIFIILALLCFAIVVQACGSAHIRPGVTSDISQYSGAYISDVKVSSKEQNDNSLKVNKKMETYANDKLLAVIKNKKLQLTKSPATNVLAFKLDIGIIYGSRAARYWTGFGAGRGTVSSTFQVLDSMSGEVHTIMAHPA